MQPGRNTIYSQIGNGPTSWISVRGLRAAILFLPVIAGMACTAQAQSDAPARLAALEARLAALEHEIALLEDSKAIKRLQRAYGYYVDKGLSREIAGLFSDQATVELGGLGVYVGKDRIAALYQRLYGDRLPDGSLNNHIIMQGVVHVAPDGRTAKGRWRALIQTGQHGMSAQWAEGPYENEYIKEDGIWKFSKIHWFNTFTAPYDPGWHKNPLPLAGPPEDFLPDLPPTLKYETYPAAFLPPYHYDNPVSGRKAGAAP